MDSHRQEQPQFPPLAQENSRKKDMHQLVGTPQAGPIPDKDNQPNESPHYIKKEELKQILIELLDSDLHSLTKSDKSQRIEAIINKHTKLRGNRSADKPPKISFPEVSPIHVLPSSPMKTSTPNHKPLTQTPNNRQFISALRKTPKNKQAPMQKLVMITPSKDKNSNKEPVPASKLPRRL